MEVAGGAAFAEVLLDVRDRGVLLFVQLELVLLHLGVHVVFYSEVIHEERLVKLVIVLDALMLTS